MEQVTIASMQPRSDLSLPSPPVDFHDVLSSYAMLLCLSTQFCTSAAVACLIWPAHVSWISLNKTKYLHKAFALWYSDGCRTFLWPVVCHNGVIQQWGESSGYSIFPYSRKATQFGATQLFQQHLLPLMKQLQFLNQHEVPDFSGAKDSTLKLNGKWTVNRNNLVPNKTLPTFHIPNS